MNINTTPYASLDPSLILDAIESLNLPCSGSLFALNSYENRVYQIGIDDAEPVIAKFYRPNRWSDAAILEEHQFAIELKEHDLPVVAPLVLKGNTLHEHNGYRFAVFPRQGGRTIELDNYEQLEWVGRFIGRLHAVGACRPFQHRLKLSSSTYGHPYQYLLEHDFIPPELKHNFKVAAETAIDKIDNIFAAVGFRQIRLHGDCHAGNILWNNNGPQIVDLDDCLMGPAVQDIWMLMAGGSKDEMQQQLNSILRGYCAFQDFDYSELRLIEALRTLRMMQYAVWLAKRWDDPAFPKSFPWFNTPRYWQEQLYQLNEQIVLLDE